MRTPTISRAPRASRSSPGASTPRARSSRARSSAMVFTWELILKPAAAAADGRQAALVDAASAVRAGRAADADALLTKVPEDADADYLASAARIALVAGRLDAARTLFTRALER